MLVGWGGNNGSTFTASLLAHQHAVTWETRTGTKKPNYFGSLCLASTTSLGLDSNDEEVYVPFNSLLPMIDPKDLVVSGWDISGMDLYNSCKRAQVLEPDLLNKLEPYLSALKPLKSVYFPDFIAENQEERADNVLVGTKKENLEQLRNDIKVFKSRNMLEKVIVMWTANTERFSELCSANETANNLLKAVEENSPLVSQSTLFGIAAVLEGCTFINGSPQNTFVPGLVQLAQEHKVFIGGDDFKSGQTKVKSVLVDFLVSSGIKPVAITSYNHLGNNDGRNLSAPLQFRSKEVSKSNVVDDMVNSNSILYEKGEKPDHVVVIKYVPSVGDSKRALDEYESEIFMNGRNTISMHNTCEDSLLAVPLMLDLILLSDLLSRISVEQNGKVESFNSVLSLLSFMLKAPLVPNGKPVVNALAKQRSALENVMRACIGLKPQNNMTLEHRF